MVGIKYYPRAERPQIISAIMERPQLMAHAYGQMRRLAICCVGDSQVDRLLRELPECDLLDTINALADLIEREG